ncbi:MAG: hypothetical protein IKX71_01625 [Bacteroidales bacterium]|nr:hypothetical protein [Bacteroidales bacterium]
MKHIGIDIGTSSICGVVYDESTGQVRSVTKANDAAIGAGQGEDIPAWAFRQDASRILQVVRQLLDELMEPGVASIGFSGQMHGMLYTDAAGNPVSPLYTWQDGSAAQPFKEGKSYAQWLTTQTGYETATGYGLATHFYNLKTGNVPARAVKLCTVMDFAAMSLCGKTKPLCEPSNAASLGFFDRQKLQFDGKALAKVGIDTTILPEVCPAGTEVGSYRGIPVYVPIGDNQAAFLGSVQDKTTEVHVTIGTSSQISVFTKDYVEVPPLDTRPLPGGGYILVGAALCGGCSLALLKDFYKQVITQFTGTTISDAVLYDKMSGTAASQTDGITVRTTFEGTRRDATLRGQISGIDLRNLTPDRLTTAFMKGICQELKDFYDLLPESIKKYRTAITGSGNALRKNPLLKKILSETFGLPVVLTSHEEEAALGAAIAYKA